MDDLFRNISSGAIELGSHWKSPFSTLIYAYPFVTSLLWSVSGLFYLASRRLARRRASSFRTLPAYSVVIPFHAEPDGALATAASLSKVRPRPLEIILIDDGSPSPISPGTVRPLGTLIVRLPQNVGKAAALQSVLGRLRGEIVVCMDADTVSESPDWSRMLACFNDPALAAVTGKLRPTRSHGLIEWLQTLDYLTVIMVIKAAESSWGGLMTVSGAFTAFRISALRDVGGWSGSSSTEDIDISWRLEVAGWRIAFEYEWIARVEMAPNLTALWRQRRRWSAGLGRALRDHGIRALAHATHLPVVILTLTSLFWLASVLTLGAVLLFAMLSGTDNAPMLTEIAVAETALVGAVVFYLQLAAAVALDGRGVTSNWPSFLIAPVYPVYFWAILVTSFLVGFPKGFFRRDNGRWRRTERHT